MNRDPRWIKTIQVLWLGVFSFWLGSLDARAAYDAHYWLTSAVFVVGIGGSAYLLLRDVWKKA